MVLFIHPIENENQKPTPNVCRHCRQPDKVVTTTMTKAVFTHHVSEWSTIGTVTPRDKFNKTPNCLVRLCISLVINKFRLLKTTESPYIRKRNTQNRELAALAPEQSKFIRLTDTENNTLFAGFDPDPTTFAIGRVPAYNWNRRQYFQVSFNRKYWTNHF